MIDEDDLDERLDREVGSQHLLALVIEYSGISEAAAVRSLGVDPDSVRGWAKELAGQGLIEVTEVLGERIYEVTPAGMKKLRDFKKELLTREEVPEKKPRKSPKQELGKVGESVGSAYGQIAKSLAENWMDALFLVAILFSLFLLKEFYANPNMEGLSFLLGMVLLSLIILLYSQYKKQLKARAFEGFLAWLREYMAARRKYVATVVVAVALVYVSVMLFMNPQDKGYYVILAVVVASTGLLAYNPKKDMSEVARFYVGVTLIAYGLMLLVDWVSVTQLLFNAKSRLIDAGVGVGLLLLVQLNQDYFGIKMAHGKLR